MRHVSLCQDTDYLEREAFIIEKLFIPEKWVHYAKVCIFSHLQIIY